MVVSKISISLITYNNYRKEQKKKYKEDPFKPDNWPYHKEDDYFICANEQKVTFQYVFNLTDNYGFTHTLNIYESENCTDCPVRSSCTKVKRE